MDINIILSKTPDLVIVNQKVGQIELRRNTLRIVGDAVSISISHNGVTVTRDKESFTYGELLWDAQESTLSIVNKKDKNDVINVIFVKYA